MCVTSQIPPDEYRTALQHLMSDVKFRCHVWCYNVPAAIVFFTLLLGACLAVIPLVESRLLFKGTETGLEFVHGGILWLCTLTIYMVVVLVAKRQVSRQSRVGVDGKPRFCFLRDLAEIYC